MVCRSSAAADGLALTPAGGPARRPGAAARPTRACRSGSSPGWRGRAIPGPPAGRRRPRAGGSPRCAASPCGPRSGAPGTCAEPAVHDLAHGALVDAPPAGAEQQRRAAAVDREGRAPVSQPVLERLRAPGWPNGTVRSLAPLPSTRMTRRRPVDIVDVEADEFGDPDAAGVEQLDDQPIAASRSALASDSASTSISATASSAPRTGGKRAVRARAGQQLTRIDVDQAAACAAQAVNVRAAAARRASVLRAAPRLSQLGQPAAQDAEVDVGQATPRRARGRDRAADTRRRCSRARCAAIDCVRGEGAARSRRPPGANGGGRSVAPGDQVDAPVGAAAPMARQLIARPRSRILRGRSGPRDRRVRAAGDRRQAATRAAPLSTTAHRCGADHRLGARRLTGSAAIEPVAVLAALDQPGRAQRPAAPAARRRPVIPARADDLVLGSPAPDRQAVEDSAGDRIEPIEDVAPRPRDCVRCCTAGPSCIRYRRSCHAEAADDRGDIGDRRRPGSRRSPRAAAGRGSRPTWPR